MFSTNSNTTECISLTLRCKLHLHVPAISIHYGPSHGNLQHVIKSMSKNVEESFCCSI